MSDTKPSGTLPSQLIDEKTFYTLGGASAAVLLICWAINYIAVGSINYKVYRLLGFLLSEAFAVIIVMRKKDRNNIKWLFTFLNGLLIFVNASGLNIMTSSSIFDAADSSKSRNSGYYQLQKSRSGSFQLAGIFPLPRMMSWWPDEKLIDRNAQLEESNNALTAEINHLKSLRGDPATIGNNNPPYKTDSVQLLQTQLIDKQKEIDGLNASMKQTGNDIQLQLASCLKYQTTLRDSILFYANKFTSCQQSYNSLQGTYDRLNTALAECNNRTNPLTGQLTECNNKINSLTGQLTDCNNKISTLTGQLTDCNNRINSLTGELNNCKNQKNPVAPSLTLTETFRQLCEINSMRRVTSRIGTQTDDELLSQQPFYINMNWPAFCKSFNSWYNVKGIK